MRVLLPVVAMNMKLWLHSGCGDGRELEVVVVVVRLWWWPWTEVVVAMNVKR
jgi:hypothetical protein